MLEQNELSKQNESALNLARFYLEHYQAGLDDCIKYVSRSLPNLSLYQIKAQVVKAIEEIQNAK